MAPRQRHTLHHKMFFLQMFHSRGSANFRDLADRLNVSKSTLASIINERDRVVTVCRSASISYEGASESRRSYCPTPGVFGSFDTTASSFRHRWSSFGGIATPPRLGKRNDDDDNANDPRRAHWLPTRQELVRALSTLRRVIECLDEAPLWYTFALDDLFLSCMPAMTTWETTFSDLNLSQKGNEPRPPERKDVLDAVWTVQRALRNAKHPAWFSFAVNRLFRCYLAR